MQEPCKISIIIPALDEADIIAKTLASLLRLRGRIEVVVVDGGSRDGTPEIARNVLSDYSDARIITSRPGRGNQLNAGASLASGDVLVFLHADTLLPDSAPALIEEAVRNPRVVGGNFRMACGGPGLFNKIFSHLNTIRRWFGIYYGDSVIWVRREVFKDLNGYMETPIMEDYDFCRRLERAGQSRCLAGTVVTSPRRWSGGRALKTITLWTLIQWLYMVGISPDHLARLYYPKRFKRMNE